MAKQPFENQPYSIFPFWGKAIKKGWKNSEEKLGRFLTWLAIISPIILFAVILLSKNASPGEESEREAFVNRWEVFIPFFVWAIWFVIHVLKAPHDIYKEQFVKSRGEIEVMGLALKKYNEIKPLEIRPLPVKNTPRHDGMMLSADGGLTFATGAQTAYASECHIEIYNPNQGVDVVRVRILNIQPPMPSRTESVTTDDCNLRALYFPFTDIPDEALNKDSSGDVCIFKIVRTPQIIIVRFEGKWNDTCQNSFTPKNEHIITIQVEARNVPQKHYLFKLSFSLDPTRPAFILKEITPETNTGQARVD